MNWAERINKANEAREAGAALRSPWLHDEMLAALRAAEEVLYGGAAISRTQALLMVQAAVMRAEKEEARQQQQAPPCGCQQKRHNCDEFNNLPVTVRES